MDDGRDDGSRLFKGQEHAGHDAIDGGVEVQSPPSRRAEEEAAPLMEEDVAQTWK
jgi:hypothetical protein